MPFKTIQREQLFDLKSALINESAALGDELLSSSNWTATNWTGDFASGFAHTTGNTTALSNSIATTISYLYYISFTVTGRTVGNFTITLGGQVSPKSFTATDTYAPKATTTGNLIITPTTDFNGTISNISMKRITASYSATETYLDSTDAIANEIRFSAASKNNFFFGIDSGKYNVSGYGNVALGAYALQSNTSGYYNMADGISALRSNTTGYGNVALGQNALFNNTSGYYNMAIGAQALNACTTASGNVAVGSGALSGCVTGSGNIAFGSYVAQSITSGNNNIALGAFALYGITTTGGNIAFGYNSGRYLADGATANQTSVYGMYLGYGARASVAATSNEIAIGYNTIGNGSNTVTLGNTSITKTFLRGTLNAAGTTPPANASSAGAAGDIAFDANYIYTCVATNTWKRVAISTW